MPPLQARLSIGFMLVSIGTLLAFGNPSEAEARKELLTPEEKETLHRAERIHIDPLALTGSGPVDASGIAGAVAARMERLGYRIVTDSTHPHDITLKVKCEEAKRWEGTGRMGGDADMVDAAARLWKGPACQITYRVGNRWGDWRHEVRASVSSPEPGASNAGQREAGALAITALVQQLHSDPFPYLLAAEWEQSARLIAALNTPGATTLQKQTVIGLLGQMLATDAIPQLATALKDTDPLVVQAAATALGTIGHEDAIAPLMALFQSGASEQHRAAALGLGRLAPLHPGSDIVPTLIAALPKESVPMQTIIVRALGKTTDRRVLAPLRDLHRATLKHTRSDSSAELKELLTTLGIALDGFDGVHTEE